MSDSLNEAIKLNSGTFENDEKLEKLPIPDLKESFDLYLSSIRAISPKNITEIKNKIDLFVESNEAKVLQNNLKSRQNVTKNWLEEWWLDEAYLRDRSQIIPYLNIAGISILLKSVWPLIHLTSSRTQRLINVEVIRRASRYVYSILLFWICLRLEMVVVNRSREGAILCMDQLKKIFNTCRIPNEKKDILESYFQIAKDNSCPRHITVGCHGRIFIIYAVNENDEISKLENIEQAFEEIVMFCEKNVDGPGLATLSSMSRNQWSDAYKHLKQVCQQNATNIDLIQNSILWICLSTDEPPQSQLLLEKALKVDAKNVWADKSLYVSFYSNGLITYGANHAPVDGVALGTTLGFCEREILYNKGFGECRLPALKSISHSESRITWKELQFEIPEDIPNIIENALCDYLVLCFNIEAQLFTFSTFNRLVSRQLKLHPDTVFQLCLQLAYVNIHGIDSPATVYETATSRQFAYGRTETIRSCTEQSVKWMKAFKKLGPYQDSVGELFLKAHNAHNELRSRCESGRGCDRHLLGLRMMSKVMTEFETPLLDAIFDDASYAATGSNGTFILSTSPMGAADSTGAVAPMCENGYGVFYRIVEDCCEAAVTSWRSNGHGRGSQLLRELNNCFRYVPIMSQSRMKTKL